MKQSELFPIAKRTWRRLGLKATEEEVGQECGVPVHVTAAWSETTPDLITIRAARREVEQDVGAFQGGSRQFG